MKLNKEDVMAVKRAIKDNIPHTGDIVVTDSTDVVVELTGEKYDSIVYSLNEVDEDNYNIGAQYVKLAMDKYLGKTLTEDLIKEIIATSCIHSEYSSDTIMVKLSTGFYRIND